MLPVEQIEVAGILIAKHESDEIIISGRVTEHLPGAINFVTRLVEIVQIHGRGSVVHLGNYSVTATWCPVTRTLAADKVEVIIRPGRQVDGVRSRG